MKLSIIIVNWNTRDITAQCLHSVAASLHSFAPTEVETIVVENGSDDGSAATFSDLFPWVNLILNQTNMGFAHANNQGIAASRGEFVLLLNSDTVVQPNALVTLLDFMEGHPKAGVIGALLLNEDGSLQISCSPFPTLGREAWRLFHLDDFYPLASYPMHTWPTIHAQSVDVLLGACMLIRRAALDQVGLLDDSYFMYSEEVDLCLRIKRAGWEIYWVPQAQVIHLGGQSSRLMAQRMFLQLYRSKVIYFRKHYGAATAAIYKFLLALAATARLSISPLTLLEPAPRRQMHRTLTKYYYRLLGEVRGW